MSCPFLTIPLPSIYLFPSEDPPWLKSNGPNKKPLPSNTPLALAPTCHPSSVSCRPILLTQDQRKGAVLNTSIPQSQRDGRIRCAKELEGRRRRWNVGREQICHVCTTTDNRRTTDEILGCRHLRVDSHLCRAPLDPSAVQQDCTVITITGLSRSSLFSSY
jgi:hypothetical protein